MVAQRDDWLSIEDFLALDRESLGQKYEYRNGRMIAMGAGSKHHGMLISNLHLILGNHLKGSPCFVFTEMTLKLEDTCPLPDVMVTCDEKDLAEDENPTYIEHPKLVIEVLSPSTEKDDRGEKFLRYVNWPSVQEYALISQDMMLAWLSSACARVRIHVMMKDLPSTKVRVTAGLLIPLTDGSGTNMLTNRLNFMSKVELLSHLN